jgi:hypothetical protein
MDGAFIEALFGSPQERASSKKLVGLQRRHGRSRFVGEVPQNVIPLLAMPAPEIIRACLYEG